MAPGEETSDGLKYKVVALKVSVHCEGCKKKIEKILKKTADVYKYDIDASKKKVTVLGNVDADTLIKKLAKAGKNAELWPEKTPANINSKNNDEKGKTENNEPPKSKEPQQKSAEKKPAAEAAGGVGSAAPAAGAVPADSGKKNEAAEEVLKSSDTDKKEAAKSDEEKVEASTPLPEKSAAASAAEKQEQKAPSNPEANGNSSGSGKKKGKKAQKEASNEVGTDNPHYSAAAAGASVRSIEPPVQHLQPYPIYLQEYHPSAAPPMPPAYMMSYNMSQPSVSHSYYAPPMPASSPPEYSYAPYHSYQPYPPTPMEYFYGTSDGSSSSQQQQHQQSYDSFFSEENPNGCSLM